MTHFELTHDESLIIEEYIDESLITEEYKDLGVINCSEDEYQETDVEEETIDDWIDLK